MIPAQAQKEHAIETVPPSTHAKASCALHARRVRDYRHAISPTSRIFNIPNLVRTKETGHLGLESARVTHVLRADWSPQILDDFNSSEEARVTFNGTLPVLHMGHPSRSPHAGPRSRQGAARSSAEYWSIWGSMPDKTWGR